MNTTNKNLNRRALPKFLLWVGIGALVGFCAGLASGILGGLNAEEWVSVRLPAALGAVAPWGIPVTSAILLGVCLGQYRAAKKLCDSWDGEDETAPDQADQRLNIVLLCSSLAMILDFLFLGMGVLYTEGVATAAVTVAEMLVSCALVVLAQQKTVDLTRRMNPEKQVSAYDSKFQEKWYEVCDEAEIPKEEIREIDVAANCTMMHMLLGVDARSIGRAPYRPEFTEAKRLPASGIGIEAGKDTLLYCLPQVSGYIGADIVAGAYVCALQKEKGRVLFIDIGTNGEIVLASQGRILCCSCAAGPALEGMNISSGMRAAEGAIEDVKITPEGNEIKVIGGQEPVGICGSGILAVVKELLRTGIVKKTGAFIKKEKLEEDDYRFPMIRVNGTKREFVLHEKPEILVTQGDVRQVQLAKGAILSGFTALLEKAAITMGDLDKVMIAGQFGAHLPAESLVGTGILPEEVKDKLIYVGTSSKTGAYMALMSARAKQEIEELASEMEYIELAETENYERIFADSMIFP